ncbi:uncharacterized protein LOC132103491 [Carassius carassius]|uniref:uncharacterized protein LOC132103491 n=1 Tax=Carassius carassius TaxID=217509 RepID=UPI0028694061|nr:uncharacterized protein LOC132103491 [Carassius carassius]
MAAIVLPMAEEACLVARREIRELDHISYFRIKFGVTENSSMKVKLCGLCSYSVELSSSEHLYMMKSFQLSCFQLLYLLTAALLERKGETERPCKQVHQLNIRHLLSDNMSISCQTTTHPLDSLTVKLRSINQDKVILMYPDISPASEPQRWSVRKDAGNVTLDLKDIRSSDGGLYNCQVYKDQDCLHTTRFNLSIISENADVLNKLITIIREPYTCKICLLLCFSCFRV